MELAKLCALIIQADEKQNYNKTIFDIQILVASSMHDIQITTVIKKDPKIKVGLEPCNIHQPFRCSLRDLHNINQTTFKSLQKFMKFNKKTRKHSNGINLAISKTIIVTHKIVLENGCTKLLQREQHRRKHAIA
jgi:hypothetical protein